MEDILRHNIRLAREAIKDVLELGTHSSKEDKILSDFREELLDFATEIQDTLDIESDDEEDDDEDSEDMDF